MKTNTGVSKKLLVLIFLTTFTIICWIALSVYSVFRKSTLPANLQEQLVPLNPDFDQKTLESLKKRSSVSQADLESVPEITNVILLQSAATFSAALSPQPSVSPSPQPSIQPSPQPSAQPSIEPSVQPSTQP